MRATYFSQMTNLTTLTFTVQNIFSPKRFPSETNNPFVNLIFFAQYISWFKIVRALEQSAMDSFDTKDDETKETLF